MILCEVSLERLRKKKLPCRISLYLSRIMQESIRIQLSDTAYEAELEDTDRGDILALLQLMKEGVLYIEPQEQPFDDIRITSNI